MFNCSSGMDMPDNLQYVHGQLEATKQIYLR